MFPDVLERVARHGRPSLPRVELLLESGVDNLHDLALQLAQMVPEIPAGVIKVPAESAGLFFILLIFHLRDPGQEVFPHSLDGGRDQLQAPQSDRQVQDGDRLEDGRPC